MKLEILGMIEGRNERGRVVNPTGISVAMTGTDWKDPPKVLVKRIKHES